MLKLAFQYGRYVWNRGARHLFSRYRWVILLKPVSSDRPGAGEQADAGHCRRATPADYDSLIAIYPSEFSGHLPEKIKREQLLARARRNLPCFVAEAGNGALLGATWCLPYQDPLLDQAPFGRKRVFEMVNTFVVPECRGKGIGQNLRKYAIRSMAHQGYEAVISFVWYSRQQSLNMNLRTGSTLFGEKSLRVLLGTRSQSVRPVVRLDRLPLGELPPLVLVGGSSAAFHQLAQRFELYGVRVRKVELNTEPPAFPEAGDIERLLIHEAEQYKIRPILFCCDSAAAALVAPVHQRLKQHYVFLTNDVENLWHSQNQPAAVVKKTELGMSGPITAGQELLVAAVPDTEGKWLAGFVFSLKAGGGENDSDRIATVDEPDLLNKAQKYFDRRTHAGPVVLCPGQSGASGGEPGGTPGEFTEQLIAELPFGWVELFLLGEMSNMAWCALLYLNALGRGHSMTCWKPTPTEVVRNRSTGEFHLARMNSV